MHRFSMDQQITPNYNKSDPPQRLKSLTKNTGKAREKLNAAEVRVIDQPKPSRPSDETQTSQGQERVSGHRSGAVD